jgi:hypothetical protein
MTFTEQLIPLILIGSRGNNDQVQYVITATPSS